MATPRCALRVHCQHPQLALRSGHKCRRCHRVVHVLCAEEDPQADASTNLTCFFCTDPPKFSPPENHPSFRNDKSSQSWTSLHDLPQIHLQSFDDDLRSSGSNSFTTDLHQPKVITAKGKKQAPVSSKRKKSTPASNSTGAATKKPKPKPKVVTEFRLDANTSKPDPLLMKPVAFDVDDKLYGTQLYKHFGGEEHGSTFITTKNGKRLLLGTVVRVSKKKKGPGASSSIHYDIQWEEPDLGDSTSIDVSVVNEATALHSRIMSSRSDAAHRLQAQTVCTRNPFSTEVRKALLHVEETEIGSPESSEDEDEINADTPQNRDNAEVNDKIDNEEDYLLFCPDNVMDEKRKLFLDDNNNEDSVRQSSQFCWSTVGSWDHRQIIQIDAKAMLFLQRLESLPLQSCHSLRLYH
jgi:hypothetical protein